MTEADIRRYDPSDMRKLLVEFPRQLEHALEIGAASRVSVSSSRLGNIVISGLGGSAIGGDLLRSHLSDRLDVPITVNRHYFLPDFVDRKSLVVIASYSGNTEETISVYKDAVRRKARIVCVSSNGQVERMASRHGHPIIMIPKGFPPRAALGYSCIPLLMMFARMKLIFSPVRDIRETISLLTKKAQIYSRMIESENLALSLAMQLHGKLPIVYSSADRFDIVNLRWRGQLAENAKVLAFGHVLPEMNHNELVGWEILKSQMKEMLVVFLRDKEDHARVKIRMDITKNVIREAAHDVIEVHSEGVSLLSRMFSLIYLGDWVSWYLAILNNVDPTPVKVIDMLKNELGKKK